MVAMVELNVNLWNQFSGLAREKQKRPNRLMEKLIAEYLAIQKDLQLDEAIRRQAPKNGFRKSDAVALVKQHRQAKKS